MTGAASPLPAQDTTQILNRLFTGRVVAQPAMGNSPLVATVLSATATQCTVTLNLDGFSSSSFTCVYQPFWYWNGSAHQQGIPPQNTPCLVCFPPNEPNGLGWVISFTGWPTHTM